MNKTTIIIIAIVAVVILAFFMLKGGGGTKTTTSTNTSTSNQTNGLLGAIADIWGGFGGMFSGGDDKNGETENPCEGPNPPAPCLQNA
jgi:hypothetical protein